MLHSCDVFSLHMEPHDQTEPSETMHQMSPCFLVCFLLQVFYCSRLRGNGVSAKGLITKRVKDSSLTIGWCSLSNRPFCTLLASTCCWRLLPHKHHSSGRTLQPCHFGAPSFLSSVIGALISGTRVSTSLLLTPASSAQQLLQWGQHGDFPTGKTENQPT